MTRTLRRIATPLRCSRGGFRPGKGWGKQPRRLQPFSHHVSAHSNPKPSRRDASVMTFLLAVLDPGSHEVGF